MRFLLFLVVFGFCVLFPVFRCFLLHPVSSIYYGCRDLFYYIKRKEWNVAPYGKISCYIADGATSFGCGKTLSSVEYIQSLYTKFNGKLVWSGERQKFVKQRIHILSNVDFLQIPYEKLVSLSQFVQETNEDFIAKDIENDELTVTYLFIDEASSQLNSRQFKSNFDPLFISRLLTSRHVRASVICTSQRFSMVDKLLREVTNIVVGCNKIWRFQVNNYYDAHEMENAVNPQLVKPLRRSCWFVRDSSFKKYDTFSSVQELKKSFESGDMLSEEEILNLQAGPTDSNMDIVKRPSRWWIRSQRNKSNK